MENYLPYDKLQQAQIAVKLFGDTISTTLYAAFVKIARFVNRYGDSTPIASYNGTALDSGALGAVVYEPVENDTKAGTFTLVAPADWLYATYTQEQWRRLLLMERTDVILNAIKNTVNNTPVQRWDEFWTAINNKINSVPVDKQQINVTVSNLVGDSVSFTGFPSFSSTADVLTIALDRFSSAMLADYAYTIATDASQGEEEKVVGFNIVASLSEFVLRIYVHIMF